MSGSNDIYCRRLFWQSHSAECHSTVTETMEHGRLAFYVQYSMVTLKNTENISGLKGSRQNGYFRAITRRK